MISYRIEQRRLRYRNRVFHFVTSEPLTEATRTAAEAVSAVWVLMDGGRCHEVMSRVSGRPELELDRALLGWVERNIEILTS
ncbi:MAG: hypothetical protein AMS20_03975 [Gemmatimonas sp. SG8_28]|nr:MAG: hypothetical protein AMS20_03975 [Gemmatimonas sp. SG8_28]